MTDMWKIYGILVGVMIMWGLNVPLLKYLVANVAPVTMTTFRILLAGLTVSAIIPFLKIFRLPTRREWLFIVAGALFNVVLHHYFLTLGLARTSGSNAGLILGTGPVLTAVLVSVIMRNYPSKIQWLGLVLGLGGVSSVVLAGGGTESFSLGDVFIFIAILVQVYSFIIIAQISRTLDPRLMTAYMFIIGSVILFIISLVQEPGEIKAFASVSPAFWLAFAASGIIATAIGHMLYNYSVGIAGPSKAAIFINFNTMFSLIGSAVFLGEVITIRHLIGLVLIISGVLLGSGAAEDIWKNRQRAKEKEEIG